MYIMSTNKCKKVDRYTIDEIGIPSIVLMENAANEIVNKVVNLGEKFIVFCGNGNNGGDGLAIARKLILKNKDVYVVIINRNGKCSSDFSINSSKISLSVFLKYSSSYPIYFASNLNISQLLLHSFGGSITLFAVAKVQYP